MGGQKRLKLSYTHSLKSLNDSNFSCGQVNLALTAEGRNIPPADTISDAQTDLHGLELWESSFPFIVMHTNTIYIYILKSTCIYYKYYLKINIFYFLK